MTVDLEPCRASFDSGGSEESLLRRSIDELDFVDSVPRPKGARSQARVTVVAVFACALVVGAIVLVRTRWQSARKFGPCGQILVRRFESYTGLGSEYGVFLRAAALSAEMGWTVVPVTTDWIYGDLDNFFVPPSYRCTLPPDLLDDLSTYKEFGTEGWEQADRLRLTRNFHQLLHLDGLIRNRSIDPEGIRRLDMKQRLWSLDEEHLTLPYGESVPRGVDKAFLEQVDALKRLWVPNFGMQAQIDRLAARVGLNEARSTRRPVVAVQVRLGDKKTELDDLHRVGSHMQLYASTHMPQAFATLTDARSDDMNVYFQAIQVAIGRLYEPELTPGAFPRPSTGNQKPLVVVMTAEPGVTEQLSALDKRNEFDFILTPSSELTPEQQEEYDRVFNSTRAMYRRWDQKDLDNASLNLRLALTRQLIAELTVYSRMADAFVVSGNSNLGRLALTLAGEEGALGLPGQRIFGGRVRSIDVPFYPTTWRTSIFA
ncbi:hypothetical protein EXIGLDRAFT_821722 [Exidia glandulosa HHB12029]|uniref:Uncharacterized protein n=1 Tax=Exidia glandulosa HHB12029 TaxID=1314781 RepID=A0A165JMH4_EXIGL|nr:hypothetical protein EXIGLDRAFT_821722 [Exidia glandulosa HHB12029]